MEFTVDEYEDAMHFLSLYVDKMYYLAELITDIMDKMKERKIKRSFLTSFNNLRYCIEKFRLFTQQSVENLVDISNNFEEEFLIWIRKHPNFVPTDFEYEKYNIKLPQKNFNATPGPGRSSPNLNITLNSSNKSNDENIANLETQLTTQNNETNIAERILLDENSEESPVYLESEDLLQYLSLRGISKIEEAQKKNIEISRDMPEINDISSDATTKSSENIPVTQDLATNTEEPMDECTAEENTESENIEGVSEASTVNLKVDNQSVSQNLTEHFEENLSPENAGTTSETSTIDLKDNNQEENTVFENESVTQHSSKEIPEIMNEGVESEVIENMSEISEASTICLKNRNKENKIPESTSTSTIDLKDNNQEENTVFENESVTQHSNKEIPEKMDEGVENEVTENMSEISEASTICLKNRNKENKIPESTSTSQESLETVPDEERNECVASDVNEHLDGISEASTIDLNNQNNEIEKIVDKLDQNSTEENKSDENEKLNEGVADMNLQNTEKESQLATVVNGEENLDENIAVTEPNNEEDVIDELADILSQQDNISSKNLEESQENYALNEIVKIISEQNGTTSEDTEAKSSGDKSPENLENNEKKIPSEQNTKPAVDADDEAYNSNSEKEVSPKETTRDDKNSTSSENQNLESEQENSKENTEDEELAKLEKLLDSDSLSVGTLSSVDDLSRTAELEQSLLYGNSTDLLKTDDDENEIENQSTKSENIELKDAVVKIHPLDLSDETVLFEDLISDLDSNMSLSSDESLRDKIDQSSKSTDLNNLISEIDTSDDERKNALKEIMNDSMSSSSLSSNEESDNNNIESDFENEVLNQTSGKIVKLNVEELEKKLENKSSTINTTEPMDLNELSKDETDYDSDEKLSKMRPVVELERLNLPSAKKDVSKKNDDDDDISRLLNISSLKRRYPRQNADDNSSVSSTSSVRKRLRKKRKKKNSSASSSSGSDQSNNDKSSSDSDQNHFSDISVTSILNKNLSETDSSVSFNLSSIEEISSDDSDDKKKSPKKKKPKKSHKQAKGDIPNDTSGKDNWKNDPLLRINVDEDKSKRSKIKNESNSDSDVEIIDASSEDDVIVCEDDAIVDDDTTSEKRKYQKSGLPSEKKQKKLEQLLLEISSDSNESVVLSDNEEEEEEEEEEEDPLEPGQKKRKIRKVLSYEELAEATKRANEEEKERLKRLSQRLSDYETIESLTLGHINTLVLEYDLSTEKPKIVVPEILFQKLKDHQKDGVKFMWDSCFESADRIIKDHGSGCVLAHCMGLGKTLQIITLIYTLFSHPETRVKRVLILAPVSTIKNWLDEFRMWLEGLEKKFSVYTLIQLIDSKERANKIKLWLKYGGVMIINYTLFRTLIDIKSLVEPQNQNQNPDQNDEKIPKKFLNLFRKALLDPGPHLLVCDEGHTLKNSKTLISRGISKVKTGRRIMLTGTPMQNNLKEYYCMINLVKPNLLGSEAEFNNQFVNPITAGQAKDSSMNDIRRMKRRAHVLHKKLSGVVQRVEASVLKPYLPDLLHYVVFIKLSEKQKEIYKLFTNNAISSTSKRIIPHYQIAKKITAHPICLTYHKPDENQQTAQQTQDANMENQNNFFKDRNWWRPACSEEDTHDVINGTKLIIFFQILNQCEMIGDKVIVFSTSLFILNAVEHFLKQSPIEGVLNSKWISGEDYVRVDGETPKNQRHEIYKSFNDPNNVQLRLLMASTKVSGLGVNLIGANRIIILDTPWNPADNMQSVYRIYRFGQEKKCYIYSLVSLGTMEEKIYERSVTKQALACRVVDEQQIDRHYARRENITNELYRFHDYDDMDRPPPNVPSDRVLANILQKYPDIVWKYHEHDKLLENQEDEELDEAEREAAWQEFQMEEAQRHTNQQRPAFQILQPQPHSSNNPPPMNQFSNTFSTFLTSYARNLQNRLPPRGVNSSRRRVRRRGFPRTHRGFGVPRGTLGRHNFNNVNQSNVMVHLANNQHPNEMPVPSTSRSNDLYPFFNNQGSADIVSIYDEPMLYDGAEIITSDIIDIDDPLSNIDGEGGNLEE